MISVQTHLYDTILKGAILGMDIIKTSQKD